LEAGLRLTAFEEDTDALGERIYVVASGVVEPSPDYVQCRGSKWSLRIDERGVRHEPKIGDDA
jgi:hypothetical protein